MTPFWLNIGSFSRLETGWSGKLGNMTKSSAPFQQPLLARRAELEELLARLVRDEASIRHDRADATADDEHDPEGVTLSGEWQKLDGLQRAMKVELEQVNAALSRIEDGTYGVCVSCGKQIPHGRLEVRPMATMCVPCAEKAS